MPSQELNTTEETLVSPAEMVAELHLLGLHGYGEPGEPVGDEESRQFFAEVERLNPDWQPGQIPKVPAGYEHGSQATPPELSAWREAKIREFGEWAYWQEGEFKGQLKADWLLAKGPERYAADMERMRRTMLSNRARLAQLRRNGYWFDEEHRLQAPIASAPTGRILVASRAPRSRSARRTSSARGDPDPEPEPDLAPLPGGAR